MLIRAFYLLFLRFFSTHIAAPRSTISTPARVFPAPVPGLEVFGVVVTDVVLLLSVFELVEVVEEVEEEEDCELLDVSELLLSLLSGVELSSTVVCSLELSPSSGVLDDSSSERGVLSSSSGTVTSRSSL